jgi:steroid 5-alpha reductase family enzyme
MALRPSRSGSLLFIAGVYIAAIAVAWLFWLGAPLGPQAALFAGLFASSVVVYGAIQYADNGSVFDAWWSVLPPFAALWLTGLSDEPALTARQMAVLTVVWFWSVRLTLNWARSWPGLEHEDWRYRDLAEKWPLPAWAVRAIAVVGSPTLVVGIGCLPLHPAVTEGGSGFGLLDVLALTVGLAATSLELVADEQMRVFAETRQPGDVMDRGLWRLSRHPNYFGEICFWISLWLFAVAASPAAWWTGIGAIVMIAMFVFASIPLLDDRSTERRPGFAEYAARTPLLVPWPRRRTGSGATASSSGS